MPRLLVAALPLLAGLLPMSAWALGLGEITLRSALNQPFRAEIPVTADSADELARLEVVLAPRETFQRFGLDRPAFLGDLRLAVEPAGARDGVIRISSTRPITEPFVTLLLEARWPAGRLLREYTVLLDPPAFVSDEARAAPALPAAPAPAPAETIRRAEPAPAPSGTPAPRPAAATPGGDYQVQRSDTLWQVAQALRPDPSVSVNQMMVALFRANPEAFAGNINRLRAGAILRVPGGDELRGLAAAEANAEVARQNSAWRGDQGERLQLVPPAETPAPGAASGGAAAGALQGRVSQLEQELAEARRLLSVRDDELRALQAQLSGAAPAGREEPVAALPPAEPFADDPAAVAPEPVASTEEGAESGTATEESAAPAPAPPAADTAARPEPARTVVSQPPSGGGVLDTLLGLLTSVWLWGAAAVVVALSLFLIRRRREEAALADDEEDTGRWSAPREPTIPPVATTAGAAAGGGFIVEERAALPERDSDSDSDGADADGLDQTRSAPVLRMPPEAAAAPVSAPVAAVSDAADGPADVIAEADFHMAYGLYDQAADLLNEAISAEPGRRDLRMKLLEVLFVWENKGAFLRAARELHGQVNAGSDPDWAKAVIMGRQLCPDDALFAAAGSATVAGDLDFSLDSEESASTVDFSIDETGTQQGLSDLDVGEASPTDTGLDFDFDPGEPVDDSGQGTTSVATVIDSGGTMETPTLEARFSGDSPTLESPTLQAPGGSSPTMETPTIETRGGWADDAEAEPTEAIDLDELGLDFSGLDEAADALSTGLHQALDEAAGDEAGRAGEAGDAGEAEAGFEFDFSESFESGDEEPARPGDAGVEPTEEMPALADAPDSDELDALAGDPAGDTAEHQRLDTQVNRQIDDTAEQPRLGADEAVDFDLGEALAEEDFEPTASIMAGTGRLGSDGPTMTEVGTKLDLARAYIDMGDPDGARSILNEVLEEGDAAQRQEARQLLGELPG